MTYKSIEDIPVLLSIEELQDILSIGRTKAYELIRSGQIRSIRIGHLVRIAKSDLLTYLEDQSS
ncbi:MAG: helix-turn-helix domain-containing protein [Oscillospiraceae bacterium]|nr:helix-turn-helix domain-containing protein [Oscillospiraceae bacterium]